MAEKEKLEPGDDPVPFWPNHAMTEIRVAFVVLLLIAAIGILGHFNPVGVEEPADPLNTPAHAKPEWYFLFLYEFVKYVPKTVGVMTPIIGVLLLIFVPFLDRRKADSIRGRQGRIAGVVVLLILIGLLTYLGASA